MTMHSEGSPGPRRVRRPARRYPTVLGIPLPLIVVSATLAVLVGLTLTRALEATTIGRDRTGASIDTARGGNNAAALPVVTEGSLGTEVESLIDDGALQPTTSFDAVQCLQEQGSTDAILLMEEVAWGPEQTPAWLLVHGPMDKATLQATGGTVSTTVVLPECGSESASEVPTEDRLWTGTVLVDGTPT